MATHADPTRAAPQGRAKPVRAPAQRAAPNVARPPWAPPLSPAFAVARAIKGDSEAPTPETEPGPASAPQTPGPAGPPEPPRPPNRTGLPDALKSGIEALSGLAMDDVRVHRNSAEPARLGALAFAQGSDIHLGFGQEQHLPHEAWHVVQQKQGRVQATWELAYGGTNDHPDLEHEATVLGAKAAGQDAAAELSDEALRQASPTGGGPAQLKPDNIDQDYLLPLEYLTRPPQIAPQPIQQMVSTPQSVGLTAPKLFNHTGSASRPQMDTGIRSRLSENRTTIPGRCWPALHSAGKDGVVQFKLARQGQELTPPLFSHVSPVAELYLTDEHWYVLRDDCSLGDPVIHVLDRAKKYLLGEEHDDGTWTTRTLNWSVDTMHEAGKAIPEARAPRRHAAEEGGQRLPLESLHAYVLQVALAAQSYLRRTKKAWTMAQEDKDPAGDFVSPEVANLLAQIKAAGLKALLAGLKASADKIDELLKATLAYDEFGTGTKLSDDPAFRRALLFSFRAKDEFRPALLRMRVTIRALLNLNGAVLTDPDTEKRIEAIDTERGCLESLVHGVLDLMPAEATELLVIGLAGRESAWGRKDQYMEAGMPYREEAMIRNIDAAKPPLLVQIGDEHVERVANRVEGAVGVRLGTDFETITKRTG